MELDKCFTLFNKKQCDNMKKLLPENGKLVTFLNPYSIFHMVKNFNIYSKFSYICSDGILPIILNKYLGKNLMNRYSFDFTSLAEPVFNYAIINNLKIYFWGSEKNTINLFVRKISKQYPSLVISGFSDGFSSSENVIGDILEINPDIVIIGMGTPLQDILSIELSQKGFQGCIYTCGGFFHQFSRSENKEYYPTWVNKLNIRWIYRMIKEPHTRKRYIIYYPKFIVWYSFFLIKNVFKS
ncbi:WecB/TagA/CpsF family glycosyltransferase [Lonepinella sp. BR2919]|uniref:WecB/TagA/CpsF family glycosyltransferase n=1 Tax=unclassified Lonepinella TaxID=2642006 RepID=UPI003F6DCA5E